MNVTHAIASLVKLLRETPDATRITFEPIIDNSVYEITVKRKTKATQPGLVVVSKGSICTR